MRQAAPADVKDTLRQAESRGGGIVWTPQEVEEAGAFGFTRGDWKLYVGMQWVHAADGDPAAVFASIQHELGGHNRLGQGEFGWDVMSKTLDDMPEEERTKANSALSPDGKPMNTYTAYGYIETEIIAELYEASYDRPDNPTDHPFAASGPRKPEGDVVFELQLIKTGFAPKVAEALVRGLCRRVQLDPKIHDDAKQQFRVRVEQVFGFTP